MTLMKSEYPQMKARIQRNAISKVHLVLLSIVVWWRGRVMASTWSIAIPLGQWVLHVILVTPLICNLAELCTFLWLSYLTCSIRQKLTLSSLLSQQLLLQCKWVRTTSEMHASSQIACKELSMLGKFMIIPFYQHVKENIPYVYTQDLCPTFQTVTSIQLLIIITH